LALIQLWAGRKSCHQPKYSEQKSFLAAVNARAATTTHLRAERGQNSAAIAVRSRVGGSIVAPTVLPGPDSQLDLVAQVRRLVKSQLPATHR